MEFKKLDSISVEGNWVCTNLPPRNLPLRWIYHISKVFTVLAYVQEFCCDFISCAFFPIGHINIHLSLVKLQHVHILSEAKKKKILDLPSPYFTPLLYDQLWFYGEGFIEHLQWDMGK
jgi:hypothetical protein